MLTHTIPPVYDENSRVLILGSFPSVKSREQSFFYGHPQNRFWKTLALVLGRDIPVTIVQKRELLLSSRIALWDVIESCDITGSSDSSIRNVVTNDISIILNYANIGAIFVNGKTAEKYYNKYLKAHVGRAAICLPSTSPANATCSQDALVRAWTAVADALRC